MRQIVLSSLAALMLVVGTSASAHAGTLFYGGDWYGNGSGSGTSSSHHRSDRESNIFQNCIVPAGQTWTIQGVFANHLISPAALLAISGADWSIRSGVSSGNGGTIVASGSNDPISLTSTGRGWDDSVEDTVTVNGLNVILPAGTYWMNVTPVLTTTDSATYNTLTIGANAVGMHLPDNDYGLAQISGLGITQNFVPLTGTYSNGVLGSVPEPTSFILAALGCVAVISWRSLRRASI